MNRKGEGMNGGYREEVGGGIGRREGKGTCRPDVT